MSQKQIKNKSKKYKVEKSKKNQKTARGMLAGLRRPAIYIYFYSGTSRFGGACWLAMAMAMPDPGRAPAEPPEPSCGRFLRKSEQKPGLWARNIWPWHDFGRRVSPVSQSTRWALRQKTAAAQPWWHGVPRRSAPLWHGTDAGGERHGRAWSLKHDE